MALASNDVAAITAWVNAQITAARYVSPISNIDPLRDFGLELEKKQFAAPHQAVTDPAAYKTARDAQFTSMETEIKRAYDDALTKFYAAGLPKSMAEQYALAAAANERNIQKQLLETMFPSGANAVFAQSLSHRNAGNFAGSLGDPAAVATVSARRAPVKRRKSTRRR